MSKEEEYKEIFLAEALENYEELNRLLTQLEKSPGDKKTINAIFRITHTLKGNAAGMGFKNVSDFSHILEDLFGEAREGKLVLEDSIFTTLFKALDTLGKLINAIKDNKAVKFRGIKTKMEVLLRTTKNEALAKSSGEEKSVEDNVSPANDTSVEEDSIFDPLDEEPENDNSKISFSDLVQVPVRKLDNLLNLVEELVIERDRIIASNSGVVKTNEYTRLNRISSDLQYSVMDVRLVQVGFLFNKFHRVVRDAANLEKKKVGLVLKGTETEIDRNILQIISDSLIHLIRNSVGHGIEKPEIRKKNNKKEEGVITLSARSESDAVIIEIIDDGAGIDIDAARKKAIKQGLISPDDANQLSDNEMVQIIFEPGFSTMNQVTAISGRGVGMDVVKKALDSIGGNISVDTKKGIGTTFSLRLPSSMAVKGTLLFELDSETFAIPLSYTKAVVSLYKPDIHKVANGLVSTYLGNIISIVFLKDILDLTVYRPNSLHKSFNEVHPEKKLDIVIVSYNNRTIGLVVDKLLQQKEIVEKPLMRPFDKVKLISGVTIMGNGHVCLVLNVAEISNLIFSRNFSTKNALSI
ncbi:chemotaxis protein CheA [Fulvivirga sp. 29W222]|uniref:Chemotaxis protein CheA n=1 Tax=Fulvivirga marina TaxID=2494733 RepID=A0A937FZ55_9BACT|nr:chemotaxis protein CheA [Fulvivirga marina]MBL6447045.1 chemotaxis protein CheA [Fulvivirga marina]